MDHPARAIRVTINQQQAQLLDRLIASGLGASYDEVIANGFRRYRIEQSQPLPSGKTQPEPAETKPPSPRSSPPRRHEIQILLEPGTGKAVELPRGHVLRVEQVQGGQCADFNAFNLHDYREAFHCGRTRVQNGLFPTEGDVLWSAPPRERPMLTIIADTVGSNDISFPRCTGLLFESAWGYEIHTNCQDILAEALREYGLTPDDVHDSFNMWMNTTVDSKTGRLGIENNLSEAGDYIEMLAHFDVLAAVSVCGADLSKTSNFSLHPLRIFVREATAEELKKWSPPAARRFVNQKTPADFRVQDIRSERKLSRDPRYVPHWPVYPVVTREVAVGLSDGERALLRRLAEHGGFGSTSGEVLRYQFFSWCVEHFIRTDPLSSETGLLATPEELGEAPRPEAQRPGLVEPD